MRTLIKHIAGRTYKPLLEKYLSSTRVYTHNGLRLVIPPEVFHPAFFTSTHLLWKELLTLELKGKTILELGAGSGLIALQAAKYGAIVSASDLNNTAVQYLKVNSFANKLPIRIIQSDLFDQLPGEKFDIIAINPPYYSKDASSEKELAWYCGSNGEYFHKLFMQLHAHCHSGTEVLMVLCDGCDLAMIASAASKNNWAIKRIRTKRTLIEDSFIFQIKPCADIA